VFETHVTILGNLVAEPQSRQTKGGIPFTAFRIASTPRFRNREGLYEDGQTSYYSVTAFRSLATNLAASLRKGDPVIVQGRQRVSTWQREDQSWGTSVEIEATAVGHDLCRGTSEFTKSTRASTVPEGDRMGDAAVREVHEALDETSKALMKEGYELVDENGELHGGPDVDEAATETIADEALAPDRGPLVPVA